MMYVLKNLCYKNMPCRATVFIYLSARQGIFL